MSASNKLIFSLSQNLDIGEKTRHERTSVPLGVSASTLGPRLSQSAMTGPTR